MTDLATHYRDMAERRRSEFYALMDQIKLLEQAKLKAHDDYQFLMNRAAQVERGATTEAA